MPTTSELDALAHEIKAAQDLGHQIEPFTARVPGFDLAAAYAVAERVHRARLAEGARPVGRKIGFTNPDMWARYGVGEPIWAWVYDTTVTRLAVLNAECSLANFCEPKIEPEIVFGFGRTPTGAGPTEIVDAIDWVAHGFEIVQSHFPGWKFRAPDTVADWSLHGSLMIGPGLSLSELGEDPVSVLETFTLSLSRDGRRVETGSGSNVLGNPFAAIGHLVAVLERQVGATPLVAGEIVTTGTITTAQAVQAGETWRSSIEGAALPGLAVEFTP